MSPDFDLAIVGAGPCGLAVGAAAVKAGLSPILLEAGPVVSSLVHYPPYMEFFSTAERLELEDVPFPIPGEKPSRQEAMAYYRGIVRHFALDVRTYHRVDEIQPADEGFLLGATTRLERTVRISAGSIVLATGGFHEPNRLGVPGEELDKVHHYWSEAHPYWNQDVLVVGGGNSAVESALQLFRVGARVTLVHFEADLDRGVKPWVLPDIRNRLEKGEIVSHWRSRVEEILPDRVLVRRSGSDPALELPNDWVFAMTGWRGDSRLLDSLGVPIDPATGIPEHDPDTMETPVSGVFLAGVVAAGHDANRIFIENGRMHGRRVVETLIRRRGSPSSSD